MQKLLPSYLQRLAYGSKALGSAETRSTMGDKSVETLDGKIRFLSVLVTSPSPLSPKTMLMFLFRRLHRPQRLHNIDWGAGGIRELTLDANKIKPLFYRKAAFPESVSTTFVAYCLEAIHANCTHFLYIPKL